MTNDAAVVLPLGGTSHHPREAKCNARWRDDEGKHLYSPGRDPPGCEGCCACSVCFDCHELHPCFMHEGFFQEQFEDQGPASEPAESEWGWGDELPIVCEECGLPVEGPAERCPFGGCHHARAVRCDECQCSVCFDCHQLHACEEHEAVFRERLLGEA